MATSAVEYNDNWRTDVSLFEQYVCDSVPSDTLSSILAKIDTLISDSFFYRATPVGAYDLYVCEDCDSVGYNLSLSGDYCVKYDTVDAIDNGSYITVSSGDSNGVYSTDGARIYESVTSEERPVKLSSSSTDFYKYRLLDVNNVVVDKRENMDRFWNSWASINNGRLNTVGVWGAASAGEWIGFSHCVDVQESKYYYVGFASDNKSRLKINGEQIANFEETSNVGHFKYWHILPVWLEAGPNVIEMEGLNEGGDASFGAEIYDVTEFQLANYKNESDLDAKIIFSTKDKSGDNFDLGVNTGYSCPDGYALNLCGDSAICTSVSEIPRNQPCDFDCPRILTWDGLALKDVIEVLEVSKVNTFTADLKAKVLNENSQIDTINLELYTPCDTLFDCEIICTFESKSRRVNPFLTGIKGNWRPNKSWTYVNDRDYESSRATPQTDGQFAMTEPFWQYKLAEESYVPQYTNISDEQWVWTSEVTEYSPFGMELENKDPLGRYSSALYGYAKTLPVAVASNTRHRELWYEGFEEYMYLSSITSNFICPPWQYPYVEDPGGLSLLTDFDNLDEEHSHSGNLSLRLDNGDTLVQEIALNPSFVDDTEKHYWSSLEYFTEEEDQIVPFRPAAGKYILSAWVSEMSNPNDTLFETTYITVEMQDDMGGVTSTTFLPKGLIIDGWQRIEEILIVPENTEVMRIIYKSDASIGWFDDFRIFPYHGSMKSYAYDFRTLRLMAELDENNYATFYEYDLEGNLVRIKKETERGIKSLQESRQHQKSTN